MRKLAISLAVLSIACGFASAAPAQNYSAESPVQYLERMRAQATQAREQADAQWESRNRGGYQCNNPMSSFCEWNGVPLGIAGQRSTYGWWDNYYPGYRVKGRHAAEGHVWEFPYSEFSTCPPPPPETRAPKGYRWACERKVYAFRAGYIRKGSEDLKDLGTFAVVLGTIAVVGSALK